MNAAPCAQRPSTPSRRESYIASAATDAAGGSVLPATCTGLALRTRWQGTPTRLGAPHRSRRRSEAGIAMLNPTQEVLSRVASPLPRDSREQPRRNARKLLAVVGQLASVTAAAATVTAIMAGFLLGYWAPMPRMSMVGVMLLVWSAIMLVAAFAVLVIFRRYRVSGTVPKLPAALSISRRRRSNSFPWTTHRKPGCRSPAVRPCSPQ